jgi:hypothetical protein
MNFPYAPRLDSRQIVTGVYNAGSGTTSFTLLEPDGTIDCIVLGDDFGALAGTAVTPLDGPSTAAVVRAAGQLTMGPCILGRKYDYTVELSRPFRRDNEGYAIIDDRVQVETLVADHRNTGAYTIRAVMPNRTDRTKVLDIEELIEDEGQLRTFLNGDTKRTRWIIESDSPLPVTISAVVFEADVSGRTRK